MRVNKPLWPLGEFLTFYKGKNKAISSSANRITSQKIILKESVSLNGGIIEYCCLEIKLLNRNFLLVLNGERIYEILEQDDERIFIQLTESWMCLTDNKQENSKYIVHGLINLNYKYAPLAEFAELFIYQINLDNDKKVRELFNGINE